MANWDQEEIKLLLSSLAAGQGCEIKPATKEKIDIFHERALADGVDSKAISQLIDLYQVANGFSYETVIDFHDCEDEIIFEWWSHGELWLGLRDFYVIRWANNKFCLGDASNSSFSAEYEYGTLIELIKGCIDEIRQTEQP